MPLCKLHNVLLLSHSGKPLSPRFLSFAEILFPLSSPRRSLGSQHLFHRDFSFSVSLGPMTYLIPSRHPFLSGFLSFPLVRQIKLGTTSIGGKSPFLFSPKGFPLKFSYIDLGLPLEVFGESSQGRTRFSSSKIFLDTQVFLRFEFSSSL